MSDHHEAGTLYDLCRQASKESDSEKLAELVKRINHLLDQKAGPRREEPDAERSA